MLEAHQPSKKVKKKENTHVSMDKLIKPQEVEPAEVNHPQKCQSIADSCFEDLLPDYNQTMNNDSQITIKAASVENTPDSDVQFIKPQAPSTTNKPPSSFVFLEVELLPTHFKIPEIQNNIKKSTMVNSTQTCREMKMNYARYVNKSFLEKIAKLEIRTFCYETYRLNAKAFEFYTGLSTDDFDEVFQFFGNDAERVNVCKTKTPEIKKIPCLPKSKHISAQNQMFLSLARMRCSLILQDLAYRYGVTASFASKLTSA